jgi:quercetin dioxygenase-like cupin family protein
MSWFVVFASAVLPIALLFIMLALEWLQRGAGTTPSLLGIRRRDGADNKEGTKRLMILTLLMCAGMLAVALVEGQDLNAQTVGPQVATLVKTEIAGVEGMEWNVLTVELAPGAVDIRHFRPGVELVYVLEGAGVLGVDGQPPVALNPGVVATLHPKQPQVFKNTSPTQTLKVLVVLLLERGHQRPMLANGGPSRHQKGLEHIANGDLRQPKTSERKDSTRPGLVF